jgi:glycosyltransferase involved in cell wall biosynthesis
MACGTPVISSSCSSLPETLGKAAVLIDPNDPEELTAAMGEVICDKIYQSELIAKGYKHVALHTWQKAAERMKAVFLDISGREPWQKKSR